MTIVNYNKILNLVETLSELEIKELVNECLLNKENIYMNVTESKFKNSTVMKTYHGLNNSSLIKVKDVLGNNHSYTYMDEERLKNYTIPYSMGIHIKALEPYVNHSLFKVGIEDSFGEKMYVKPYILMSFDLRRNNVVVSAFTNKNGELYSVVDVEKDGKPRLNATSKEIKNMIKSKVRAKLTYREFLNMIIESAKYLHDYLNRYDSKYNNDFRANQFTFKMLTGTSYEKNIHIKDVTMLPDNVIALEKKNSSESTFIHMEFGSPNVELFEQIEEKPHLFDSSKTVKITNYVGRGVFRVIIESKNNEIISIKLKQLVSNFSKINKDLNGEEITSEFVNNYVKFLETKLLGGDAYTELIKKGFRNSFTKTYFNEFLIESKFDTNII